MIIVIVIRIRSYLPRNILTDTLVEKLLEASLAPVGDGNSSAGGKPPISFTISFQFRPKRSCNLII